MKVQKVPNYSLSGIEMPYTNHTLKNEQIVTLNADTLLELGGVELTYTGYR